ncbi:hypothetical protein HETIRDRAFT_468112 [Heterobasidion irregulare TC 32-1]|uniref:Uncharacterized protein n=1 Tax=Heterobasidion irregulare (strain TC 32-1) TaxID=747525 RepID=W4KL61_HETIT|nr:uncharacterized protein HETIRDRAFT_468112 [Heterobasidion irregulare TC 32-1]ETW86439.1 hypothetical protein HETIRDRAFT_468112 [Heterobasidion irregulare TC 32-1]
MVDLVWSGAATSNPHSDVWLRLNIRLRFRAHSFRSLIKGLETFNSNINSKNCWLEALYLAVPSRFPIYFVCEYLPMSGPVYSWTTELNTSWSPSSCE